MEYENGQLGLGPIVTYKDLAKKYGVSTRPIRDAIAGRDSREPVPLPEAHPAAPQRTAAAAAAWTPPTVVVPPVPDVLTPEAFDTGALIRSLVDEGGLHEFIRIMWSECVPQTFVDNWHIGVICEYLEAVALGQITRLVINIPPGCMKPVACSEPVWTLRGYIPLGNVVVGDWVLTHMGRWRQVTAVHEQGDLPIVALTTHSGRTVRVAPDHPMLTPRGWVQAQHLAEGDHLGLVCETGDELRSDITPEQARLAGYMVGDGCLLYNQALFTNQEPDAIADFEHVAGTMGWSVTRGVKRGTAALAMRIKQPRTCGAVAWFTSLGLWDKSSYTKRIPPQILSGSKEVLANFVGAYWTCDGTTSNRSDGPARRGRDWRALATTVSEGLAQDLLVAMQRLGIRANLRIKTRQLKTLRQGDVYKSFNVEVVGQDSLARLTRLPGLCARKRREYPRADFDQVLWSDPISSIAREPAAPCRCLTVEQDHSFTCSGFAVKNSLSVGVFWPAWMWTLDPKLAFLFGSFDQSLLNNKQSEPMIELINSKAYQAAYPYVQLAQKSPALREFKNTEGGFRFNTSPEGKGTGRHVDHLVVDDPMKPQDAIGARKAAFDKVTNWFDGTLPTRVRKAIVLIMQRVHTDDLAGMCKARGYETLILPMRQTRRAMWEPPAWVRGRDPRTEVGELLWPAYKNEEKVRELEIGLKGEASAQLQQDPTPATGGIIEEPWTRLEWITVPADGTWVQSWDFSSKGTLESHSKVSGQLWCVTRSLKEAREFLSTLEDRLAKIPGSFADSRIVPIPDRTEVYCLIDWVGGHWNYVTSKSQFVMAQARPHWSRARFKLIEDKANGTPLIEEYRSKFAGIKAIEPEGEKEERLKVHSEKFELGLVLFPPRIGDPVREELVKFPRFSWDDHVDTATQALDRLSDRNKRHRENLARAAARGKLIV